MKKVTVTFLIITCLLGKIGFSQPQAGERFQKAQKALEEYMTKELNLSTEESQKLKPVYRNYFLEMKNAKKENNADPIATEEEILTIRKKYKEEFKKILITDERVNRLFFAERNFKDILRKELINRRLNRGSMRDPSKGLQ